jgi:ABC-type multidrug transport system fused ATPase/permease subunit
MQRIRPAVMGSIRRIASYQVRQQVAVAFTSAVKEPLSIFFIVVIVIVQVTLLDQAIAPILVAIVLFHRGIQAVFGVQSGWQAALNTVGAVEMVRDELDALQRHREEGGETVIGPLSQGIELDRMSFAYQDGHQAVLSEVSLVIPARTTVALVGMSGAGKSTLVDLLTLLLKPTAGAIRIDGVPGSEIELASWRSQIGYVSQETVIFDDTIAANIAMLSDGRTPDRSEWEVQVREAARRAHIADFIEELPEGYDTVVGDRGVRLSGGQRQRLFIARELFKRPNLLILDEATSALDSESEQAIQQSIDSLRGHMTVVVIAHRLSTIRNVDRVFVLERGRLVEEGDYAELRELPQSRFREMVELQIL